MNYFMLRLFQKMVNLRQIRMGICGLSIITIACILAPEALCSAKDTNDLSIAGICQPVTGNESFFGNQKIFHTFHGRPVPLTFFIKGAKAKLKNPALVLYLPKSIKLLEILQGSEYGKDIQYQTKRTTVSIHGKIYFRYQTKADLTQAITSRYRPARHACQLVVALDAPADVNSAKIYWALQNNGHEQKKQMVTVKFLKPLALPVDPGQFRIMSYSSMPGLAYHSAKLQKAACDLLLSSGIEGKGAFRDRSTRRGQFDKYLRSRGVALYAKHFWGGPLWSEPVAGVPATVTASGKLANRTRTPSAGEKIVHTLAPIPALNSARFKKYYFNKIAKKLKKTGPCDYAIFDYEPWRWPEKYGFDKQTLAEFARQYHIKEPLTSKLVLNKYRGQWTKFWVNISTRAVKMMAEACRAANPNIKTASYTYFFNYNAKPAWKAFKQCPKDPRQCSKYLDQVMLSAYHLNGRKLVNKLRRSKRHIHLAHISVIGSLVRHIPLQSWVRQGEDLSPQQMYQKVILCAALGVKCFGLYPGRYIDGAFYVSLGKAARLIWNHEKFYYHGLNVHDQVSVQPADSTKERAFAYTAQQYNGKRLISLFNFLDKPLQLQVHMKGSSWAKSYTLPAHGVKLIKIK